MKGHRDTYNTALRLVKERKARPTLGLKKLVVTARDEDNDNVRRMKETPANIRVRAVLDLIDAFKASWEGFKKRAAKNQKTRQRPSGRRRRSNEGSARHRRRNRRNGKRRWARARRFCRPPFEVSYKARRLTSDSFGMEPKSIQIQDGRLFLFRVKKTPGMEEGIKMSEGLQCEVEQCCRIQYCFGRWYLLVPYRSRPETPAPTNRIAALDPGIRTFQAFYHEHGAGEIVFSKDQDHSDRLEKTHAKIERLKKALREAIGEAKRRRLRRAWYRQMARAKHLVADLHYKTIAYLLDNFDVVIAPRLSAAEMLKKEFGLRQKTKRRLRALCHGLFHQRLVTKAKTRGKVVFDLREHGTSRTCSDCGLANHALGSSKTFSCPSCGFECDRDINSGKNHYLKFLVGNNDYE